MLTKLTLTIDKSVVEQAKKYAQRKHRSVSKIVEAYLQNISAITEKIDSDHKFKSPITEDITGMFKNEYEGQDYKQILEEALMEKLI